MTLMNNAHDPQDFLKAEQATSRAAALNVLAMIQHTQTMRKLREQAIRGQYIGPDEVML